VQEEHRVGVADGLPAAADADALDLVAGLVVAAQAGGVDHVQRHAFDLDRLADAVARGAGDRRDDGQLGPGQRVQQRALADVGLAGQHHAQAFAQQRALARARQRGQHGLLDGVELAAGVGLLEEVDLLLGEVERGLDQHAQPHDALGQRVHLGEKTPASERPAERAAASVLASMRSATASAWARSSLSLRKARCVNSPGSARRAPGSACRQRASSSCSTTGPPWACSSSTSSPV
jgi:hypothetical protein